MKVKNNYEKKSMAKTTDFFPIFMFTYGQIEE